ncbi:MAG: hypothetical protein IKZ47_04455 [Clostridia bacterium]|nr:hypothetical protein [Clostridia bacterium]
MKSLVRPDVSIDTISLCWYNFDSGFDLSNWKYCPKKSEKQYDSFLYYKDSVTLIYIPAIHLLMASFSASKVANGSNALPYRFEQYNGVREKVEEIIRMAAGQQLKIADSFVSRLDVYKQFTFKTRAEAAQMISWMQKQPNQGKSVKTIYSDNGDYRRFKNGLVLKAYIKSDDPRLLKDEQERLKPTVRIEVECRKTARRKTLGKMVSAEGVLRYPASWVGLFNYTLDKFRLTGKVLTKNNFKKRTKEILKKEYPKSRPSTINKYLRILCSATDSDKKKKVELINKISKHGICPFCAPNEYVLSAKSTVSPQQQKTIELFRQCIATKRERNDNKCSILAYPLHFISIPSTKVIKPAIFDSS